MNTDKLDLKAVQPRKYRTIYTVSRKARPTSSHRSNIHYPPPAILLCTADPFSKYVWVLSTVTLYTSVRRMFSSPLYLVLTCLKIKIVIPFPESIPIPSTVSSTDILPVINIFFSSKYAPPLNFFQIIVIYSNIRDFVDYIKIRN